MRAVARQFMVILALAAFSGLAGYPTPAGAVSRFRFSRFRPTVVDPHNDEPVFYEVTAAEIPSQVVHAVPVRPPAPAQPLVLTDDITLLSIPRLTGDARSIDYVVNIVDGTSPEQHRITRRFYESFGDDYSFINVVAAAIGYQHHGHLPLYAPDAGWCRDS